MNVSGVVVRYVNNTRRIGSPSNIAKADFQAFLSTAITYVEKTFNFSDDNWLSSLYPFSLKKDVVFSDVQGVVEKMNMMSRLNINMDELYDELTTINVTVTAS